MLFIINGGREMKSIYCKLYYYLFNRITDAISLLENEEAEKAKLLLISAQQETENRFIMYENEENSRTGD